MSKTKVSSVTTGFSGLSGLGSTFGAVFSVSFLSALLAAPAMAASYYVRDTNVEPTVNPADALIATNLVKSAVSERRTDRLAQLEYRAAYTLQPKLIKLGDRYLLTVEKIRGSETLFAAQAKIDNIDELDEAAKSATFEAIDEPSKPVSENVAYSNNSEETEVAAPYSNLQPTDYSNRSGQQRAASRQASQTRYANAYSNQGANLAANVGSKQDQSSRARSNQMNQTMDQNSDQNLVNSRDLGSVSGSTSSANDDSYSDHGSSVDTPTSNRPLSQPLYQNQQSPTQYQQPAQAKAPAQQAYAPTEPAARSTTHAVDVIPTGGKTDHWNLGFGPFLSHQLGSDNVMYDVAGGHTFDINSMVSLKASAEMAFSSGADKAHFFNIAAGGNYFFPGGGDNAPFLTGDIGYGFA